MPPMMPVAYPNVTLRQSNLSAVMLLPGSSESFYQGTRLDWGDPAPDGPFDVVFVCDCAGPRGTRPGGGFAGPFLGARRGRTHSSTGAPRGEHAARHARPLRWSSVGDTTPERAKRCTRSPSASCRPPQAWPAPATTCRFAWCGPRAAAAWPREQCGSRSPTTTSTEGKSPRRLSAHTWEAQAAPGARALASTGGETSAT